MTLRLVMKAMTLSMSLEKMIAIVVTGGIGYLSAKKSVSCRGMMKENLKGEFGVVVARTRIWLRHTVGATKGERGLPLSQNICQ